MGWNSYKLNLSRWINVIANIDFWFWSISFKSRCKFQKLKKYAFLDTNNKNVIN